MLSTCSCQDRCINNGGAENAGLRTCMTKATVVLPHKAQQHVCTSYRFGSTLNRVKCSTSVPSRAEQRGQLPLKSVVTFCGGVTADSPTWPLQHL